MIGRPQPQTDIDDETGKEEPVGTSVVGRLITQENDAFTHGELAGLFEDVHDLKQRVTDSRRLAQEVKQLRRELDDMKTQVDQFANRRTESEFISSGREQVFQDQQLEQYGDMRAATIGNRMSSRLEGLCGEPQRDQGYEEHMALSMASMSSCRLSFDSVRVNMTYYDLRMSMWDAGLVLFVRSNSWWTTCVMVSGILLNLFVQVFLVANIVLNMLHSEFDVDEVSDMIKWRVEVGHSDLLFDNAQGHSRIMQLCENELWSYEGDQYRDMYLYLYQPIPGVLLASLAILIWTLTTVAELRHVVQQFEAVVALPSISWSSSGLVERDGRVSFVGINNFKRAGALLLLVWPRAAICVVLNLAGCRYLAQTLGLTDIVLNAVALAFVLDADELLAQVLLPPGLQVLISSMRPVECDLGPSPVLTVLLRKEWHLSFACMIFVTIFSSLHWLIPFKDNVEAATMALCAGNLEFTFTGGTDADPHIQLKPVFDVHEGFVSFCSPSINRTYFSRYYPGYMWNTSTKRATPTQQAAVSGQDARIETVMQYALGSSGCPADSLRNPPKDRNNQNFFTALFGHLSDEKEAFEASYIQSGCQRLDRYFRDVLPPSVRPGEVKFVDCPRFNSSSIAEACSPPLQPRACVWSFEAKACEGVISPGLIYRSACLSDPWQRCRIWEQGLGIPHPNLNCEVTKRCTSSSSRCLDMSGWLEVAVDSVDYFLEDSRQYENFINTMNRFNSTFHVGEKPFETQSYNYIFLKGGDQRISWALEFKGIVDSDDKMIFDDEEEWVKAVHIHVVRDVADLSVYGLGVVSKYIRTGRKYSFPAVPAPAGSHLLLIRLPSMVHGLATRLANTTPFAAALLWKHYFFGTCESRFHQIFYDQHEDIFSQIDQHEDLAIQLFNKKLVIETFTLTPSSWTLIMSWKWIGILGSWVYKDSSSQWHSGFQLVNGSVALPYYPFCVAATSLAYTCDTYPCPSGRRQNSSNITSWNLISCCQSFTCDSPSVQFASLCPNVCLWSGTRCLDPVQSCANLGSDCIAVRYELRRISVHLPVSAVLESNASLIQMLMNPEPRLMQANFSHATFRESSVQLHQEHQTRINR